MQNCDFCDIPNPLHNEGKMPEDWTSVERARGTTCYACPDCAPKFAKPSIGKTVVTDENGTVHVLEASSQEKLRQYIARLENLFGERGEVNEQIRDVFNDARALGFDKKAMRSVLQRRQKDPQKLAEEESMLELYLAALGEI